MKQAAPTIAEDDAKGDKKKKKKHKMLGCVRMKFFSAKGDEEQL